MHHAGEETHCACEPETTEPAQHLLSAMREEDDTQHYPQNRRRSAVIRGIYSTNHSFTSSNWSFTSKIKSEQLHIHSEHVETKQVRKVFNDGIPASAKFMAAEPVAWLLTFVAYCLVLRSGAK